MAKPLQKNRVAREVGKRIMNWRLVNGEILGGGSGVHYRAGPVIEVIVLTPTHVYNLRPEDQLETKED